VRKRSADVRKRSAVAIGGLDPSGGAGILADVAAFRAAGAWGAAACASSTVQDTRRTYRVAAVPASWLSEQLGVLMGDLRVTAIKTGALGSADNAQVVCDAIDAASGVLLVVDPVMLPTHGDAALCGRGPEDLRAVIERAHLLTPNVPEAERLLDASLRSVDDMIEAAVSLRRLGPRAVLLKGGHLDDPPGWSVDVLATRHGVRTRRRRRLDNHEVHGTGCVLASLIAGRLVSQQSRGSARDIEAASLWALTRFGKWLRQPLDVGRGAKVLPVAVSRSKVPG
jgi:hydroxymethylpyrimidine/phosphomethylpyrimidine kinase